MIIQHGIVLECYGQLILKQMPAQFIPIQERVVFVVTGQAGPLAWLAFEWLFWSAVARDEFAVHAFRHALNERNELTRIGPWVARCVTFTGGELLQERDCGFDVIRFNETHQVVRLQH